MFSLNLVAAPSFPVTWKTVKLPSKESFHPCIAAVVSPSLFYLFNSSQSQNPCPSLFFLSLSATGRQNCNLLLLAWFCVPADQQKLEKVIMQLNAHCSSSSSLSPADLGTLAPGAACCARFSGEEHFLSFWIHRNVLPYLVRPGEDTRPQSCNGHNTPCPFGPCVMEVYV